MIPATKVIISMVAYLMPLFFDTLEDFRMLHDILSHTEECSLNSVLFYSVQRPWCQLRNGAIVKCEIYFLLFSTFVPYDEGIIPAQEEGGIDKIHFNFTLLFCKFK